MNIAQTLASYAKPSREVRDPVPAYGLTLARGAQFGADADTKAGGSLTSYALTFTTGIIAGALLMMRFGRG